MKATFGVSHCISPVKGPAISFLATEPQSRRTSLMATYGIEVVAVVVDEHRRAVRPEVLLAGTSRARR